MNSTGINNILFFIKEMVVLVNAVHVLPDFVSKDLHWNIHFCDYAQLPSVKENKHIYYKQSEAAFISDTHK